MATRRKREPYHRWFRLAAVAALLVPCAAAAQEPAAAHARATDSIFAAAIPDAGAPGCAVGVYRAGELVHARGFGMADLEHAAPITAATRFDVASLSKQFTAMAIHLLARRGRLSLDDDIRRHVPELADFGDTVTIRHLLHHASGLRAYETLLMLSGWDRDQPLSRERVLDVVMRQRELGFTPGDRHEYGNTNYILLALIVERVSGSPFADFMASEVFEPLGMTSTFVREDPATIIPGRAETYSRQSDGTFRKNRIWADAYATGASHIITTVEDLGRWDANFDHERVGGEGIAESLYRRMRLNDGDSTAYASGVSIGSYRGLRVAGHTGGGGGDYALVRFPDQGFATAVLCNAEFWLAPWSLAVAVADVWLAPEIASRSEQTAAHRGETAHPTAAPSPDALARYAGEYRFVRDPLQRTVIVVRDGMLAAVDRGDTIPLTPQGGGRFTSGPVTIAFDTLATPVRAKVSGAVEIDLVRLPEAVWRPSAAELAAYAGEYESEELGVTWELSVVGDSLVLRRYHPFPDQAVRPVEPGVFESTDVYIDEKLLGIMEFERDAAGRPVLFRYTTDRAARLRFDRRASCGSCAGGPPPSR